MQKFTSCLTFSGNAEEAAKFYVSVFRNSKILSISYYPEEGFEMHGKPAGSVMTIKFSLDGQEFLCLNGPQFKPTEAVSVMVNCQTQEEVDALWDKLTAGGGEGIACGWLKDRFGVFWQIVPAPLIEMHEKGNERQRNQVMRAMLQMKKLDLAKLKAAYEQ